MIPHYVQLFFIKLMGAVYGYSEEVNPCSTALYMTMYVTRIPTMLSPKGGYVSNVDGRWPHTVN